MNGSDDISHRTAATVDEPPGQQTSEPAKGTRRTARKTVWSRKYSGGKRSTHSGEPGTSEAQTNVVDHGKMLTYDDGFHDGTSSSGNASSVVRPCAGWVLKDGLKKRPEKHCPGCTCPVESSEEKPEAPVSTRASRKAPSSTAKSTENSAKTKQAASKTSKTSKLKVFIESSELETGSHSERDPESFWKSAQKSSAMPSMISRNFENCPTKSSEEKVSKCPLKSSAESAQSLNVEKKSAKYSSSKFPMKSAETEVSKKTAKLSEDSQQKSSTSRVESQTSGTLTPESRKSESVCFEKPLKKSENNFNEPMPESIKNFSHKSSISGEINLKSPQTLSEKFSSENTRQECSTESMPGTSAKSPPNYSEMSTLKVADLPSLEAAGLAVAVHVDGDAILNESSNDWSEIRSFAHSSPLPLPTRSTLAQDMSRVRLDGDTHSDWEESINEKESETSAKSSANQTAQNCTYLIQPRDELPSSSLQNFSTLDGDAALPGILFIPTTGESITPSFIFNNTLLTKSAPSAPSQFKNPVDQSTASLESQTTTISADQSSQTTTEIT